MPTFDYKGYTAEGQPERGRLDSASEAAAFETLRSMGLTIVQLNAADRLPRIPWYLRDVSILGDTLPLTEQAVIAEQLAAVSQARLPVTDGLAILAEIARRRDTRRRIARVRHLVAEGGGLANAFAQAGPKVSPLFLSLLRSGERSNALPVQMTALAGHLRRQARFRGQITTALIYPVILVGASTALFLVICWTLAPALEPLFTSRGLRVPGSIAVLLAVRDFLAAWGWVMLAIFVLAFLLLLAAARSPAARVASRLPVIGAMVREFSLVNFTRSVELTLRAGANLTDAIRASARADSHDPVEVAARQAVASLERGGRAHEAFGEMPPMFRELFRIGEETNRLPDMLPVIAASLSDGLEQRSQRLLQLLTPILTLVIGGAVAALVYTVMNAILSVTDIAF